VVGLLQRQETGEGAGDGLSDIEDEYPDEPGLEGELPHPDVADLADIIGVPPWDEHVGPDAEDVQVALVREPASVVPSVQTDQKKGGQKPAPARPVGKRIVVDLDKQTVTAMEGDKPIKTMPISSGKPGHATTKGHFTIYDTDKDHKSSDYGKCVSKDGGRRDVTKGAKACKKGEKYEGAPMPFFQRFNGAEGLHQGKLPGHPDSHGCVRLSADNAKWLWSWAGKGTTVDVGPVPAKKGGAGKK
jgi:hypothetical protein